VPDPVSGGVSPDESAETGCTRCDAPLIFLGKQDFVVGGSAVLPRFFESRKRLEMWACSECGYVELFMPTPRHRKHSE
jgi:hypothetical protein